jgi:XTP/dITP diphosphohydrolase
MTSSLNLVFCSSNPHKVDEMRKLLPGSISVSAMRDVGITQDIAETGASFVENALIKARYVHQHTGLAVFSDDSGLEVESLNGSPGIYSARYAGVGASAEKNIQKLLSELSGIENRKARFVCVIVLIINNNEYFFEGTVDGQIKDAVSGSGGFGYDPLFVPVGFTETFAELTNDVKNLISHRGVAVRKMIQMLAELQA